MFQYIQHQNQIILLSRLKTCVEWRDTNSVAVGAVWIDKVCSNAYQIAKTIASTTLNTIVLITHDRDIAAYGTRIIAVRDGKIVSDKANSPAHGLEKAGSRVAAQY